MGGHQAGEVASALVLESLQAALQDHAKGAIHEQLEEAVHRANASVLTAARDRDHHGMGATMSAVFVRGGEAYIAEVGDSRAYLLRRGRLRQITRDQSLVQLLVDHGVMSAEEARKAPGKNVILQAMGLAPDVRVAIGRVELRHGDRFLLCSDGVTNAVTDEELREIMTGSVPRAACETMIALANDRGGDDNETAIVADLGGDGLEPPDEFETITSTYEQLQAYEATVGGKVVTAEGAQAAAEWMGVPTRGAPPTAGDGPTGAAVPAPVDAEPTPSAPAPKPAAADAGATMPMSRRKLPMAPAALAFIVGLIVLIAIMLAVR
jgi:serine/threonine protein phosphatase PrpC